jgi:hypothetical protein
MYYSISWQDGMFNQTASILQFESKKERESFRLARNVSSLSVQRMLLNGSAKALGRGAWANLNRLAAYHLCLSWGNNHGTR